MSSSGRTVRLPALLLMPALVVLAPVVARAQADEAVSSSSDAPRTAAPPARSPRRGAPGYTSVDASLSTRRATIDRADPLLPMPAPLVRGNRPRLRAGRPVAPSARERDCRWPGTHALDAVLAVATDRGSHASGVVFAPGHVLTAAHAIDDGGLSFVRVGDHYRAAELLLVDHAADLAVLGADTGGLEPLPIAWHEPAAHQPVWAVGFPRDEGRTTSSGVFRQVREGALHTSAPIDAGQSGGALLACEGGRYHLLGMLRGYGAYRVGSAYVKLANHSVAVAAATIQRVLAITP